MAAVAKKLNLGSDFKNQVNTVRVIYDFAVDGGATVALDLFEADDAIIITSFATIVKTAVTSGGSGTVKVGITGDDDAFMTVAQGAVANLTSGAIVFPPAVEGTPNTLPLPVKLAAGGKVLQTVGTAALLTGKVEYVLSYISA